jgi:hypothetical protein
MLSHATHLCLEAISAAASNATALHVLRAVEFTNVLSLLEWRTRIPVERRGRGPDVSTARCHVRKHGCGIAAVVVAYSGGQQPWHFAHAHTDAAINAHAVLAGEFGSPHGGLRRVLKRHAAPAADRVRSRAVRSVCACKIVLGVVILDRIRAGDAAGDHAACAIFSEASWQRPSNASRQFCRRSTHQHLIGTLIDVDIKYVRASPDSPDMSGARGTT